MKAFRLTIVALLLVLAACGTNPGSGQSATSLPAQATTAAPNPTVAPTIVPTPAPPTVEPPTVELPTVAPTAAPTADVPPAMLTAELSATAVAELGPLTQNGGIGIEGVSVLPLTGGETPLWAVFTHGMRDFSSDQQHSVAIYTRNGAQWQKLSQIKLENADYLDERGVTQVQIAPERLWLEVQSGAGAHSGCYDLLSFDGKTLKREIDHCHDSPDAGYIQDLNRDGTPDVVLNDTSNYVFCYACGVRLANFTVMRWERTGFVTVTLEPLPSSVPPAMRDPTNRAIELSKGELWKDAQAAISQTLTLNIDDPTYRWDAALIRLTAGARADYIADSPYPLLAHLFYGDYPSALAVLRQYPPDKLFATPNPLVAGTVAEGFEDSLTESITSTTTLALAVDPNLAAAAFLHGWATYLHDPTAPAALDDIARAAKLDPNEPLYAQSLAYLKRR